MQAETSRLCVSFHTGGDRGHDGLPHRLRDSRQVPGSGRGELSWVLAANAGFRLQTFSSPM